MSSRTSRISESVGIALGRAWRKLARGERNAAQWLVENGAPPSIAKALLWTVKAVVFSILLWLAFWCALLLAAAIVAAFLLRHTNQIESGRAEQRDGPLGFGLYDERGFRIDLDENDER